MGFGLLLVLLQVDLDLTLVVNDSCRFGSWHHEPCILVAPLRGTGESFRQSRQWTYFGQAFGLMAATDEGSASCKRQSKLSLVQSQHVDMIEVFAKLLDPFDKETVFNVFAPNVCYLQKQED